MNRRRFLGGHLRSQHMAVATDRRFRWALLSGFVAAVLFVAFLYASLAAPPYAVIELRTTFLQQRVDRPAAAQIRVGDVRRVSSRGSCSTLLADLRPDEVIDIIPVESAVLIYRWRADGLAVRVGAPGDTGSAGRIRRGAQVCDLGDRTTLRLGARGDGSDALILPIAGPASAGSEALNQDHLFGGRIDLFGRALMPPFRGYLYPASAQSLLLAEGGRISAAPDLETGESWYGTARVAEGGLVVSATSETASLQVIRPGASREVEPLSIGLLALLFQDPSIAPWTIGFFFVAAVVHLVSAMVQLRPRSDPPQTAEKAEAKGPDSPGASQPDEDRPGEHAAPPAKAEKQKAEGDAAST